MNPRDKLPDYLKDAYNSYTDQEHKILFNIIFGIQYRIEELVLEALDLIESTMGKTAVAERSKAQELVFGYSVDGTYEEYKVDIFTAAVINNYLRTAKKLIDCGVDINSSSLKCTKGAGYITGWPPLFFACDINSIEMVDLLLAQKPNLTPQITGAFNYSALMVPKSSSVARRIIEAAQDRGCLDELLKIKHRDYTAFEVACINGRIDVLRELITATVRELSNYVDIRSLTHQMRSAAFTHPDLADIIDKITQILRNIRTKIIVEPAFFGLQMDYANLTKNHGLVNAYCRELYESGLPTDSNQSMGKEDAIRHAIAQIYTLFRFPEITFKYLTAINHEFIRYYTFKHQRAFPKLNSESYQFQYLDCLFYPIPNDHFRGIKKHSALSEFLTALLRRYQLGNHAYKLIGLIPDDTANPLFETGDFITEDRIGNPLFHGKYSHALQLAIIMYAIEDNKIDLQYSVEGQHKKISIQDILHALAANVELRTRVMDVRYPTDISFSDPFRLTSIVMQYGHQHGFPDLANYLIDSFCKGMIERLTAFNSAYHLSLTMEQFVDKSQDFQLERFDTPPPLFAYTIQREEKKHPNPVSFFSVGQNHMVVKKDYDIPGDFIPSPYKP